MGGTRSRILFRRSILLFLLHRVLGSLYTIELPGNITDVKTMQRLMAAIAYLERKNVQLVLDRGFYSESHVSSLY